MMRHIRTLLFVVLTLSLCVSAIAADGDDALFGLRWGMSVAQVASLGVTLTKSKGDRNFETYKTTSLPKNVSDAESYSMIFADGKLVKVWVLTKNIVNDPTGSRGKERFEVLRSSLAEKYGAPTLNRQVEGVKLFKEYDEFYQCLKYSGCGVWASVYESPDKTVSIELKGLARGTGFVDITAEAKPQFDQAVEIYKSRKTASDKDAL